MCIIFASEGVDSRPTLEELEAGFRRNQHGLGVAWIQEGKVQYEKGMEFSAKAVWDHMQGIEGPMLIHFRWASSGNKIAMHAHPFPVTKDMNELDKLKGAVDMVFAHNGTIREVEWTDLLLKTDLSKLPPGPWSDSRAFAYLIAAFKGNANFLDLWEDRNRFVTLDKDGNFDLRGDWHKEREGLWTSMKLTQGWTTYEPKGKVTYASTGAGAYGAGKPESGASSAGSNASPDRPPVETSQQLILLPEGGYSSRSHASCGQPGSYRYSGNPYPNSDYINDAYGYTGYKGDSEPSPGNGHGPVRTRYICDEPVHTETDTDQQMQEYIQYRYGAHAWTEKQWQAFYEGAEPSDVALLGQA